MPDIKRFDTKSKEALDSFYQSATFRNTPKRTIDTTDLIARSIRSVEKIPGLYQDGSGNLIAIIKEKGKTWNYKGIVVRTKSLIYPVGTVRYELMERASGATWASIVLPDHQRLYATVNVTGTGIPMLALNRVNERVEKPENSQPFEFRQVNDSTGYLKISTFEGRYYNTLKQFYDSIAGKLENTSQLVIDVRGNGGGSEENYDALKKYIYSGPVKYENIEMWVSPGNIQRYEDAAARKRKEGGHSEGSLQRDEIIVKMMKEATPYTFLPLGQPRIDTPGVIMTNPRKIVVLMNRGTASSAEAFLVFARQSNKVILAGENSGGYVGFGDVMTIQTPCFKYPLDITSFRTKLYPYEFTGIPPQYRLKPDQDWVEEALKLMTDE